MVWPSKQSQKAKTRPLISQRMKTLAMMKMMRLMMSKWHSLSKNLEEFWEKATSETLARTRNMIQEEDQIGHILVVIKLGISLRIVQKKRKRTKTLMRAHPREINQNTRTRPVKLILVKRWIQMKKANPKKKMLQQWHSKHHLPSHKLIWRFHRRLGSRSYHVPHGQES